MKKRRYAVLLFLLCLAVFVTVLLTCREKEAASTDSSYTLTIYTPHPTDFIRPLIQEFEDRTGLQVSVLQAGSGELLSRIENGEAADIMWGGSLFSVIPYSHLFESYQSKNEVYYDSPFLNGEGNMTRFTDVPSVIMVNRNLIGDIPLEGYEDLLSSALKGKIAFADPALSSSSYEHLINMLYDMGQGNPENGWKYVRKLCKNLDGVLLGSSSEVYNGVADGRYTVGLTFIIYMKEGVASTPDGVYLVKNSKNKDLH